ncbi:MAG: DUF4465 domain-containing protein [Bacteroidales bacterium]|nr:DUF4465 domain-containing protein [Bacteroidales bacterium]
MMKSFTFKQASKLVVALVAVGMLTACESDDNTRTGMITFEDVALDSTGVWNGSDKSGTHSQYDSWGSMVDAYTGTFQSGVARFLNIFNDYGPMGTSWQGMACSNHTDTATAGYGNQYSVAAGVGAAGSTNFCLLNSDSATCSFDQPLIVNSLYLTNSTYAYLALRDGNDGAGYVTKFKEGDYFKLTITGLDTNGAVTDRVDFYLADFRAGKQVVVKDWTKVDLSTLGNVKQLVFTFFSTDTGDWGMNTPAYACMDNLSYTIEE